MLARIEKLALDASVVAVIALGLLITASVVGRATIGTEVPDAIIMVRELMVAAIMLPLAAATAGRAHVSVTFVTDKMGQRLRAGLIIFGTVFAVFAMMPLLWAGGRQLGRAWASGEFYAGDFDLPRWPGMAIFLAALALMWVRLLVLAVADMISLSRTGDVGAFDPPETH